MTDLRTPLQKARDIKHAQIATMYKDLRKEQPTASNNAIMQYIGEKFEMTIMGVKKVLVAKKLYKKRR